MYCCDWCSKELDVQQLHRRDRWDFRTEKGLEKKAESPVTLGGGRVGSLGMR